ncbi:MAG: SDR family oxidoreductase [Candidatus Baltobacteraceae bacterium]
MTLEGREPRAVLVTGASSGIGAATVAALARRGFVVFAGVRNDADARAAALGPRVIPVLLDVTDAAAIAGALDTIRAHGAALHAVVNNAGIAVAGPLESVSAAELRRQFETNVIGPVAVAQAFLPMLRARRGRLAFVGSISGRIAFPFIAPYSASKFALRAIADAWRVELRPLGVRVALVEPGSVRTPIWAKGRDRAAELFARLPSDAPPHYRRALEAVLAQTEREERSGMSPERVAATIVHAVSAKHPKARYLVGAPARLGSLLALLPPALHDRFVAASLRLE